MHELSIASSLLTHILAVATQHEAQSVVSATLRVGALSCVNRDSLAFGFEALAAGTRAEGCRLDLIVVPALGTCPECGWQGEVLDAVLPCCQSCGACPVGMAEGRELSLEGISVA